MKESKKKRKGFHTGHEVVKDYLSKVITYVRSHSIIEEIVHA